MAGGYESGAAERRNGDLLIIQRINELELKLMNKQNSFELQVLRSVGAIGTDMALLKNGQSDLDHKMERILGNGEKGLIERNKDELQTEIKETKASLETEIKATKETLELGLHAHEVQNDKEQAEIWTVLRRLLKVKYTLVAVWGVLVVEVGFAGWLIMAAIEYKKH